jgi:purine-binding chemotaxis protein CheW
VTAVQALLIPVGDDLCAIPMDWVLEVVAAPTLSRLVTAPPAVIGLFNLRGQIVPLLDTAALLGTGTVQRAAFAVVVNFSQGPAGLAATAFPERGLLDAPAGPSELPGTAGLYRIGQRVALLLDVEAMMTPERLGAVEPRVDLMTAGAG